MSVLEQLNKVGVNAVFHYVPLHSSAGGRRYGRAVGTLPHTDKASDCLLRLPLWVGMQEAEISFVIGIVCTVVSRVVSARRTGRPTNLPS
jgi:dTDP-4-amino-4,6-dideoxygalactose transaminase